MTYLSEDQFKAFMEAIRRDASLARVDKPIDNRKTSDPRNLHLKDFNGEVSTCVEWAFSFRRSMRLAHTAAYDILEHIENTDNLINEGSMQET